MLLSWVNQGRSSHFGVHKAIWQGSICIFSTTRSSSLNGGLAHKMVCAIEFRFAQLYVKASISFVIKHDAAVMEGEAKRSTAIGRSDRWSFSSDHCRHSGKSMNSSCEPVRMTLVESSSLSVFCEDFFPECFLFTKGLEVLEECFFVRSRFGSLEFSESAPRGL